MIGELLRLSISPFGLLTSLARFAGEGPLVEVA
jgi:hypothetical protein